MIRFIACCLAAFIGTSAAWSDPLPATGDEPCVLDGMPCPTMPVMPKPKPWAPPIIVAPKCKLDDIPCIILTTPYVGGGGGRGGVSTLEPKSYDMLTNPDMAIQSPPEAMRVPQFDLKSFQLQQF